MDKFIRISVKGGSSYIQPLDKVFDCLDGDLDGLGSLDPDEKRIITFQMVYMTKEEYDDLPEFTGH